MHHQDTGRAAPYDDYLSPDPLKSIVDIAMFCCQNPSYIMPAHVMGKLVHVLELQLHRMALRDKELGLDKDDGRTPRSDRP